jgi:hypothetical protein
MNGMMDNGKHNQGNEIFRKLALLRNEAVWQLALVGVVFVALLDGALRLGGGTIA